MFGDERIAGDDLVDLSLRDGLRYLAKERVGDWGRRPHRQARVHRRCLPAVVIDLRKDWNAMAMHGVGHLAVAGDDIAVEAVNQFLVRPIGRMCAVLLGDDQAGAASGAGGVVCGVLRGGFTVAGVVGEMRAEHDAVASTDWA